jgi:hypothetical protein
MKKAVLCVVTLFLISSVLSAAALPVVQTPVDSMVSALQTASLNQKAMAEALTTRINTPSLGATSVLQSIDLKAQQTIRLLSNISKMLNDTAMNTIRKIGG